MRARHDLPNGSIPPSSVEFLEADLGVHTAVAFLAGHNTPVAAAPVNCRQRLIGVVAHRSYEPGGSVWTAILWLGGAVYDVSRRPYRSAEFYGIRVSCSTRTRSLGGAGGGADRERS